MPRVHRKHLVGDRAYDSDGRRRGLARRGIMTSPYRGNNLHRRSRKVK
jgi:hypothetical protein